MTQYPKGQRRSQEDQQSSAPSLPMSTWGCALNSLSPVSSVRGGWLCPLQRTVTMQPVGTLKISAPITSPCRDCLRPLSSLQKYPHTPNLHILLYSTPVPSRPGTGDTVMPPTSSSVCFSGWVQKAGGRPLSTNDYQRQPGAQLSSQTRQAVGARVGKGRGGVRRDRSLERGEKL